MPTATETPVAAFAHCQSAQCPGYRQEPVDGIRTTTDWTYLDSGGDMPGVEKSFEMVRFADEADAVCPKCSNPREISEQKRPEYPNISGHDPMGLFEFKGRTEHEIRDLKHHNEVDTLKRDQELEDLRRDVAALTAALAEKANKTGPKPKDG